MKVLIISSSPRKGVNSDVLCDPFAKGAAAAGHEVENLKKTFGLGCMRPPMKNGEGESRMAKLVVFYSRADENYFGGQYRFVTVGNTEKAAHMIADATGAELFKIEQKEPYAPDYKHCIDQAMADKRANARPELVELPESLDGYDEIYLGYPNYWGDLPMAVYTFLEAFDWTGKTIHPFCTHEGSGLSGTERNIARTCKGADVKAGLAICGSDADHSKDLVLRWLNQ